MDKLSTFTPDPELFAIYNSLGYLQDGIYFKEPDCIACLKDLLKFMRTENPNTFSTRRQLGSCNFLTTDLAPLIKQHCLNDKQLFDYVIRLLSSLTTPPILLFKEQIPDDKEKRKIYLDLQQYVFNYKQDLSIDVMFWSVIAKQMLKILQIEQDKREEEDKIILERMLILIRNILNITAPDEEDCIAGEDNTHDKLLISMKKACIYDILIYVCQTVNEHELAFHILEIFQLMFREQEAEILAKLTDSLRLSEAEKRKDMDHLKELKARSRSTSQHQDKFNRFKETTYVIKNFKSISNNDMICHKPIKDISELNLDQNKKIIRKAKNRRHFQDQNQIKAHSSSLELKSYLRDLCTQFISTSYNLLMKTVRYYLERSKSQENDETYFIWAAQFFMEFNRCSNAKSDFIMETLSKEYLHYLHCQMESYLDHIKSDKKNSKLWSRRLHNGLKAYKELIYTLAHVQSKKNEELSAITIVEELKKKLFYEEEYRELLRLLIMVYDPIKMSDAYLNDLIDSNHLFLKMIEFYCKKNENQLKVQKKKRKQKKKKNKKQQKDDEDAEKFVNEQPELIWTEIAPEISNILQYSTKASEVEDNPDLNLFNVLSDKSKDEQKFTVMKKINLLLFTKKSEESVAIFREARNFFNDDDEDTFGSFDIELDEELLVLQSILMNEFLLESNKDELKKLNKKKKLDENGEEIIDDEEKNQDEEEESDDDDDDDKQEYKEQSFNFNEFIKSFANQKILYPYYLAFQRYETNSAHVNNCIIKMFHRLAFDCLMYCMFFQLSFFRIMQNIFNNHYDNEFYSEIIRFNKFIIDKFRNVVKTNPNVFIEMLYSKTSKEAYVVEHGHEEIKLPKEPKGRKKKSKDTKNDDEEEFIRQANSDDELDNYNSESDQEKASSKKWDKLFGSTNKKDRLESTRIGSENEDSDEDFNDKLLIDENEKSNDSSKLDDDLNSQEESKSKKKRTKKRRKLTKFDDSDEEKDGEEKDDEEKDDEEKDDEEKDDEEKDDEKKDDEEKDELIGLNAMTKSKKRKSSSKVKLIETSDSEEESNEKETKQQSDESDNELINRKSKKRKIIESSDSENEEKDDLKKEKHKLNKISSDEDSDLELNKQKLKKRKIINSDNEEDTIQDEKENFSSKSNLDLNKSDKQIEI